ncbi:DEAD/DEAH box helicase [Adhaeribacter aquaticus]|uniref:DEAD/DEAH box helicase n=1 Tax=Adhaeribacter aquaticus TaxID=299567 RepID=UPI000425DF8A|nr:DEAD/DEAH box helicase [Adhaeribacter aquaticus]
MINVPTLRPYQVQSIEELREAFRQGHRRMILVIPTGGGKTTVAAEMIRKATENGNHILFLAHRKELVEQAKNRLHTFGIKPGVIMAGWTQKARPVMVASQQTLIRRALPKADVIIIDECHHSPSNGFLKIINDEQYRLSFIIGLTATPFRLDGKGLGSVGYTQIVAPITITQLVDEGHLVPARYYGPKRDMSDVHVTGGDFNAKELFSKFDKTVIYDGVIQHYNKFAPGSKAIVFNVNVEHSVKMARLFNEQGISCAHVDGETPALERAQILSDFREGKYQVLCNVNILTEGFDLPAIETVILNRATKSKALYLQMVGRGLRPALGKSCCTVIDQGGNVYMHGPVDLEEEYSLEDKPKKGGGAPPMKECPNCFLLQHTGAQVCKECNYVFSIAIHERELPQEEFEDITNFLPKPVKANKVPVPEHLRKPWSDMTDEELKEFARMKGFKPGWVWVQIQNRQKGVAA